MSQCDRFYASISHAARSAIKPIHFCKCLGFSYANFGRIICFLPESADKTWVRKLTKGLLDKQNTDVIVVDYGEGATGLMAAGNARLVGAQLAYLLRHIFKLKKRNGKEVHIIGFSAGAHVAGYTGKRLIHNGYKLGRITGQYLKDSYFFL